MNVVFHAYPILIVSYRQLLTVMILISRKKLRTMSKTTLLMELMILTWKGMKKGSLRNVLEKLVFCGISN